VTLIDTPGFDDTNKPDSEILTAIAEYLDNKCVVLLPSLKSPRTHLNYISYRKHHLLSGVIFLHRIIDNRMGGVSNKNILMFQRLVGNSALDHVICCSTMWDRVEGSVGEFADREGQLRGKYWANMIANGAQMVRHDNTAQSARSIISKLLKLAPVALVIQQELVDNQKQLCETFAGIEMNRELVLEAERQEQELQDTRARLERERAEDEAWFARELEQQRLERDRILREQEQIRARLEAERRKERRRLEAIAVKAERKAQAARELRERILRARLEAERQEERRRQEAIAVQAERRAQAFREQHERTLRYNQQASFGIILEIPYEPSNRMHWPRTIFMSGSGKKVVYGFWAQIVAKVNMFLVLIEKLIGHVCREIGPVCLLHTRFAERTAHHIQRSIAL
jgi:hypothetical protein